MAEPHATGGAALLVVATAALGPIAGEWTLILVGGFLGGCLAATSAETAGLRAAVTVLARGMVAATLFTSIAAVTAASLTSMSVDALLLPVAGAVAWQFDRLKDLALGFLGRKGGA